MTKFGEYTRSANLNRYAAKDKNARPKGHAGLEKAPEGGEMFQKKLDGCVRAVFVPEESSR